MENEWHKFVSMLHSEFCTSNHADQCGWYYELGRANMWESYAHKYWTEKAEKVMSMLDNSRIR